MSVVVTTSQRSGMARLHEKRKRGGARAWRNSARGVGSRAMGTGRASGHGASCWAAPSPQLSSEARS
jgi:hypothetical protein